MSKAKIKKGDKVVVIAGKDKGKTGEVLRVLPKDSRVLVQGVNMVKRHTRPAMGQPGGIVEKEAMLHLVHRTQLNARADAQDDPALPRAILLDELVIGRRTAETGRQRVFENPQDVVKWLKRLGREAVLVRSELRPVPLEEVNAASLNYHVPNEIRGYWPRFCAALPA